MSKRTTICISQTLNTCYTFLPILKFNANSVLNIFADGMEGNQSLRRTGLCRLNLEKTTGKRTYMTSMMLLPLLPIIALIVQYSLILKELLQYQFEVQDSWLKGTYYIFNM